jgi:hypothetical protein
MPLPIRFPLPPDCGESTPRPSGVLAAAHGFLSGRRSGQTPSPLIPVPPSTGDGTNSVNPLLPERRERPITHLYIWAAPPSCIRIATLWIGSPTGQLHQYMMIQMETRANHWPSHPPSSCHIHHPPWQSTRQRWSNGSTIHWDIQMEKTIQNSSSQNANDSIISSFKMAYEYINQLDGN